jgi:hypothetical protein
VVAGKDRIEVWLSRTVGGAITLQFTTFGASAAAGVPAVSQILNNSSAIPPG